MTTCDPDYHEYRLADATLQFMEWLSQCITLSNWQQTLVQNRVRRMLGEAYRVGRLDGSETGEPL